MAIEDGSRTERLLAMMLLHDMQDAPQSEKIIALNRAGFSNSEIADLIGSTAASVNQSLYTSRQAGKKKASKKKASKKKSAGNLG